MGEPTMVKQQLMMEPTMVKQQLMMEQTMIKQRLTMEPTMIKQQLMTEPTMTKQQLMTELTTLTMDAMVLEVLQCRHWLCFSPWDACPYLYNGSKVVTYEEVSQSFLARTMHAFIMSHCWRILSTCMNELPIL